MNTIHISVIKSASLSKTISTIRKTTGEPISLIKKHIENKEPVFTCNYIRRPKRNTLEPGMVVII